MIKFAILVRHGESFSNTLNIVSEDIDKYPLTENGIKQAKFTGEQLKKIKIDSIYSSPIRRARETAEIISSILNMDFSTDIRLKEIGFGKYNGERIENVPDFTYESEEIEPWDKIEKRMLSILNDYNGTVLLVSHAFPIRVLVAHFLSLGENESYGILINYATITLIDNINKNVVAIGSPVMTKRMEETLKK
jgi:probable phosphoglycerate mutase